MWVQSLGWEVPLTQGTCNPLHYSCLENSIDREPGGLQSMGSKELDMTATNTFTFNMVSLLPILLITGSLSLCQ